MLHKSLMYFDIEFQLYLFGSYPWLFVNHLQYPSDQSRVNYPLVVISTAASYSSLDLTFFVTVVTGTSRRLEINLPHEECTQ